MKQRRRQYISQQRTNIFAFSLYVTPWLLLRVIFLFSSFLFFCCRSGWTASLLMTATDKGPYLNHPEPPTASPNQLPPRWHDFLFLGFLSQAVGRRMQTHTHKSVHTQTNTCRQTQCGSIHCFGLDGSWPGQQDVGRVKGSPVIFGY